MEDGRCGCPGTTCLGEGVVSHDGCSDGPITDTVPGVNGETECNACNSDGNLSINILN